MRDRSRQLPAVAVPETRGLDAILVLTGVAPPRVSTERGAEGAVLAPKGAGALAAAVRARARAGAAARAATATAIAAGETLADTDALVATADVANALPAVAATGTMTCTARRDRALAGSRRAGGTAAISGRHLRRGEPDRDHEHERARQREELLHRKPYPFCPCGALYYNGGTIPRGSSFDNEAPGSDPGACCATVFKALLRWRSSLDVCVHQR